MDISSNKLLASSGIFDVNEEENFLSQQLMIFFYFSYKINLDDSDNDIITDFLCNQGEKDATKNNIYSHENISNSSSSSTKPIVPIISVTHTPASYKYGHILGK